MGKFRKSNLDTVSYEQLKQIDSDDDFEEDIFNRDLNINSFSQNGVKRFGKGVIELDHLKDSRLKIRENHRSKNSDCRKKGCMIFTIAITVVIFLVIYIVNQLPQRLHNSAAVASKDWNLNFGNNVSDSCIRLVDVDNDGRLDILLSLARPDYYHQNNASTEKDKQLLQESCKKEGLSYPCAGQLLAIRGSDGNQLWQLPTNSSILYINCDQLDANLDGQHDCLISGYHATLQAINPRNGFVIWSAERKYLFDHWNIYQALVVPDVDQDNVDDVLILHSGCCYYGEKPPPKAGRFLLFSGATGLTVGTFVDINITEYGVYRNPVLYKSSNNKITVLFTSGQLSSPGGLYQIYWDALKQQLLNPLLNLLSDTKTIYQSATKGILVPPVIVDIHGDGVMDILLSAFDGSLILYDGETFETKWKTKFNECESFSIPAPGYFNDDAYLDFMLHLNYGIWPFYPYSMVVVVSGKTGTVLWKMASSFPSFTSDLTVQRVEHQPDAFVFKTFNRDGPIYVDNKGKLNGLDTDIPRPDDFKKDTQLHEKMTVKYAGGYFRICSHKNQSLLSEEVFIMDRSNMDKPIQLAENQYFSSSSEKIVCVAVKPFGHGTGAIGDVDGDNQPDYISLTNLAMVETNPQNNNLSIWQNITLYKKTLSTNHTNKVVPIKMFSPLLANNGPDAGGDDTGDKQHDKALESTKFVPQREQIRTEYFGSKKTGIYRRQLLSDGGNTMSRRSRVLYYLVVLFTLLVVLL